MFKNKVKFVDFRTNWIVLPYSESFSEETTYIEAKLQPFSGKQEYNKTNDIRKCIRIIYNHFLVFFVHVCQHSLPNSSYAPTFFIVISKLKKLYMYFNYVAIIRTCPFILINLIPFTQGCFLVRLVGI